MYTIHNGDCLDVLPTLPAQSVDAVITDPPYPEISRDYGRLTEDEWWRLMMGVCTEVRRVLKPTGSAVFILQPNSRKVGSMRGWLWEFMAWVCRDWNMVQDVWWWNTSMIPNGGAPNRGMLRASVKSCVWAGPNDCHRDQDAVLLVFDEKQEQRLRGAKDTSIKTRSNIGVRDKHMREATMRRGGATPFNCLPIGNGSAGELVSRGTHGAGTPLKLADWWVRYIVPSGGTVLDPFNGAGTMGVAALQNGAQYIGIERMAKYVDVTHERLAKVQPALAEAAD